MGLHWKRTMRWVKRLRNCKQGQGTGALRPGPDTRCCLGVGCDAIPESTRRVNGWKWKRQEFSGRDFGTAVDGVDGRLSDNLRGYYGLSVAREDRLIEDNDGKGRTFAQIARRIEGWAKKDRKAKKNKK